MKQGWKAREASLHPYDVDANIRRHMDEERARRKKKLSDAGFRVIRNAVRKTFMLKEAKKVKRQVESFLPDAAEVDLSDISMTGKSIRAILSIPTPYGTVCRAWTIHLPELPIQWSSEQRSGKHTISGERILNADTVGRQVESFLFNEVLSGEEQLYFPMDKLPPLFRKKNEQYAEIAESFPSWFVNLGYEQQAQYTYSFSKQEGRVSAPFLYGLDKDIEDEAAFKETAAGRHASKLREDRFLQERRDYATARMEKEGMQFCCRHGKGMAVSNSSFRVRYRGTGYYVSFHYEKDIDKWKQNFDAMVDSVLDQATEQKQDLDALLKAADNRKTFADYLALLSSDIPISAKRICLDDFQRVFADAPKEIVKLIRMKKIVETDPAQIAFFDALLSASGTSPAKMNLGE